MANDTMKILAVLVAAWFIFGQGNMGAQTPVPTQTGTSSQGSTYIATTGTVVTLPVTDATQSGATVSGLTVKVSRNGGPFSSFTSGTSTASPGEKLVFHLSNTTTWHPAVTGELTVPNAPTMSVPVQVYKNATSVTFQAYSSTSVAMTTGSACGKAANQTTLGAGQTYNHKLTVQGQDKASTSDMLCILEASDATATQDMILTGSGATKSSAGTPSVYTTLAGGLIRIYDVPAVVGAVTKDFYLQVQSKTGQSIEDGDYVKITCLTKDHYIDSLTGKLGYGVEDSAGTRTYVHSYVEALCYE